MWHNAMISISRDVQVHNTKFWSLDTTPWFQYPEMFMFTIQSSDLWTQRHDFHIPRCSCSQYKVLISGHFLQRYINYKHQILSFCKLYRVYSLLFLAFMVPCSFKLISFSAKLYNNITLFSDMNTIFLIIYR